MPDAKAATIGSQAGPTSMGCSSFTVVGAASSSTGGRVDR